jgi:HTH-type transcriptional repressor of NAD biosynthesis genes
MTTRGLTLGKFAPLHKGHQFLIETALAEMDEVIVMVYDCPETTAVPLSVRAAWLRQLYPRIRVIEAWDGPTEIGDTPQIKAIPARQAKSTHPGSVDCCPANPKMLAGPP